MGAGDYVVELTVPEGPSTAGGKQSLQHLRVVARRKGYPTVVAGKSPGCCTGVLVTLPEDIVKVCGVVEPRSITVKL